MAVVKAPHGQNADFREATSTWEALEHTEMLPSVGRGSEMSSPGTGTGAASAPQPCGAPLAA